MPELPTDTILRGDALTTLKTLPEESIQCCITSPPYYLLRSYLPDDHPDKPVEIGLEETPQAYVARLVEVFREVKRVLRPDATLWVNLGDTFANDAKFGGHPSGKHQSGLHAMTRPRRYTGLPAKSLVGIRLSRRLRAARRWVASALRHHLGEGESASGASHGSPVARARVSVSVHTTATRLLL